VILKAVVIKEYSLVQEF